MGIFPVPHFFISETLPLSSPLLLAPATELEAVNEILGAIGQSPVNTLELSGVPDVIDATALLRSTLRDVEAAGWSWNTDSNYTLQVQADGTIPVPVGALEVDPEDKTSALIVRRNPATGNLSLYDPTTQSFAQTSAVACRIVWAFPFIDIPQAARTYVTIAAGRRFQAGRVAAPTLEKFNEDAENRAWALLQRIERRTRDTNAFTGNPSAQKALRRRF